MTPKVSLFHSEWHLLSLPLTPILQNPLLIFFCTGLFTTLLLWSPFFDFLSNTFLNFLFNNYYHYKSIFIYDATPFYIRERWGRLKIIYGWIGRNLYEFSFPNFFFFEPKYNSNFSLCLISFIGVFLLRFVNNYYAYFIHLLTCPSLHTLGTEFLRNLYNSPTT